MLLDYFDFFVKLDVDIRFRFEFSRKQIADDMIRNNAVLLHTRELPFERSVPECRLTITLGESLTAYLKTSRCAALGSPTQVMLHRPPAYYSNFLAGWLGLFQSPQLLQFAEFWYFWPGSWRFRWCDCLALHLSCSCRVTPPMHAQHRTDQQFWTHALWLTNTSHLVSDRTEWRYLRHFKHYSGLDHR